MGEAGGAERTDWSAARFSCFGVVVDERCGSGGPSVVVFFSREDKESSEGMEALMGEYLWGGGGSTSSVGVEDLITEGSFEAASGEVARLVLEVWVMFGCGETGNWSLGIGWMSLRTCIKSFEKMSFPLRVLPAAFL